MNLLNMQAVNLKPYAFELSEDKKQLYIGSSLDSISTIFRWNIEVKKVEWHFIMVDSETNVNLKRH
jgi:hypothetical protein